ncbi:MAG: SMP-30/gluconolactonase/LRE family protein [Acidobacteria bacterium]|nr:SMP-30/gluconolactonase/LRE family protein [Acidobacteriota bacterium]
MKEDKSTMDKIKRRSFLTAISAALLGGGSAAMLASPKKGEEELMEIRNQIKPKYSVDEIEIFGQGIIHVEGVVIDKEGNAYGAGRNSVIYKVSPDGKVSEYAQILGLIPAGVTLDRQGNLVVCDCGRQAVIRVTPSGQVLIITDRVGAVKLTLPNVACYDAEGNLYVSNSSTSDIYTHVLEVMRPEPNGALVRIRPNGKGEVVATGLYLANGVAIDPKEEAMYVLESSRKDCVRIAIKKDGSFGKPEIYAKDFPGLPDGMAFDVEGNMYVTIAALVKEAKIVGANQIIRVDTNGNWTLLVDDPAGRKLAVPTNCAFGGPGLQDLYIANLRGDHFSRIHTSVHGHPLYHQR